MAKITVDSKKAGSCRLNDLDPQEVKNIIDGVGEEAEAELDEIESTINLAAVGGTYKIGPIDAFIALGHIVLLNEINSPFVTGEVGDEGEELDPVDCMKALYVLGMGREAVEPVMAMKQRIKSMLMLKPMVEKNPELFDKLMDRVEKIAEAEKEFEQAAVNYYTENFVGCDLQDAVDSLFGALADVIKVADDMPSDEVSSKKKDWTTNGR